MEKQQKEKRRRKGIALKIFKPLMLGRYKRPEFVYFGGPVEDGAIIVSNHAGTDAPISLEFYLGRPVKFWGTAEMTSGLVKLYRYQSRVYYHEKKHWNLFLSRIFCLLASPLTNIFYTGLDMIPTYHDARFVLTLRQSIAAIEGGESIVIFPEISDKGYLDQMEGFHEGVVSLARNLYKRGIDVPIYASYFRKSDMKYFIDKPVRYSELAADGATSADIAKKLCDRCNYLGAESRSIDESEIREEAE